MSERKQREKEEFKAQVIKVASSLIKQEGLEGLSLRKLAKGLEYSTTKLYQEFGNKQDLIVFLAEDICQRQNKRLQSVMGSENPEEYILTITHEATCFYTEEPWSAQILAAVRFEEMPMPPSFKLASDISRNNFRALNLSEKTLDDLQNVTRSLMLGALSILRPNSKKSEKELVIKIIDDGMRLILAGVKSLQGNP